MGVGGGERGGGGEICQKIKLYENNALPGQLTFFFLQIDQSSLAQHPVT